MFVVKTIPQLEEAIRARAREVLVIGKLAPEMLEFAAQAVENGNGSIIADRQQFYIGKLMEQFNVSAVHDRTGKLDAALFQQRNVIGEEMERSYRY